MGMVITMSEIKLQTVRPVDPQSTERTPAKSTGDPKQFEQTLQGELTRLEHVQNALATPERAAGAAESTAIQDELRDANEMFRDLMKSKQVLSQLYHNYHRDEEG